MADVRFGAGSGGGGLPSALALSASILQGADDGGWVPAAAASARAFLDASASAWLAAPNLNMLVASDCVAIVPISLAASLAAVGMDCSGIGMASPGSSSCAVLGFLLV